MTAYPRCLALSLLVVLAAAACTSRGAADPTSTPTTTPAGAVVSEATIAFVEDLSPQGAAQTVAPAFQGARLAVDDASLRDPLAANVHVVPFDTQGTPAGLQAAADAIVADPTVLAVIVAPQLAGQFDLVDRLDRAGLATISMSTLGRLTHRGWSTWRRAVPDIEREARALVAAIASFAGERRTCLLGDGTPSSSGLLHAVVDGLEARPALRLGLPDTQPDEPEVISVIREAGCRSVVWGGSPAAGALLRIALVEAGMRSVRLFGGETLMDSSYVATTGPRGLGTIAVCPCVDLSASTDLRAVRFIQDFQSAFGVPPGPFAAEGWDVARMILDAVEAGATTRSGVAAALAQTPAFDGLARAYAFASNGALVDQADAVRVYRDEGVRWVQVAGPAG